MTKVAITQSKLDDLALHISAKSGEAMPMTIQEMQDAVDSIQTGSNPNLQAKTRTISAAGTFVDEPDEGYDGLSSVTTTVPQGDVYVAETHGFFTDNGVWKWRIRPFAAVITGDDYGEPGFIADGYEKTTPYTVYNAVASGTSVTPTESAKTIGGANYMMQGAVTVNAIPSYYVGSGIPHRTASDITASGDTVTVPEGYYLNQETKAVASGTEGTPTATKGTVSNHALSVTPSVTNTTGYITGGTKTGTAIIVAASELVSGNLALTDNTSSAVDCTNYATVTVAVPFSTIYTSTSNPSGGSNGDVWLKTVS